METELTPEQADKLNRALAGEEVELSQEEANLMNSFTQEQPQNQDRRILDNPNVVSSSQNQIVQPVAQQKPFESPGISVPRESFGSVADKYGTAALSAATFGVLPRISEYSEDVFRHGNPERTAERLKLDFSKDFGNAPNMRPDLYPMTNYARQAQEEMPIPALIGAAVPAVLSGGGSASIPGSMAMGAGTSMAADAVDSSMMGREAHPGAAGVIGGLIPGAIGAAKSLVKPIQEPLEGVAKSGMNEARNLVSKILNYVGIGGEERTSILTSPEKMKVIADEFKALKPGLGTSRASLEGAAADRSMASRSALESESEKLASGIGDIDPGQVASNLETRLTGLRGNEFSQDPSAGTNPAKSKVLEGLYGSWKDINPDPIGVPVEPGSTQYGETGGLMMPPTLPREPVPAKRLVQDAIDVSTGAFQGAESPIYAHAKPTYQGSQAQAEALDFLNSEIRSQAAPKGIDTLPYEQRLAENKNARQTAEMLTRKAPSDSPSFSALSEATKFAISGVRDRVRSAGISRSQGKLDRAMQKLASGGFPVANPFDSVALQKQLQTIASMDPAERPVYEYVVGTTNPLYMQLMRAIGEEDESK